MRNKSEVIQLLKEIETKTKNIRERIEAKETKSGSVSRAISYLRNRVSKLDGLVWRNE